MVRGKGLRVNKFRVSPRKHMTYDQAQGSGVRVAHVFRADGVEFDTEILGARLSPSQRGPLTRV